LVLALLVLAASGAVAPIRSDDAFLHLASGRELVRLGHLPQQDTLLDAERPGPWVLHSWLAELIFYGAAQLGGLPLLMALRGLLVCATLAALFCLLRARGSPGWLAALATGAAFLAPGIRSVLTRPLLFSHLLLVVFLYVLLQVRAGRWSAARLWLLPSLMVPWANLHAGHVAGAGVVVLALVALAAEQVFPPRDGQGVSLRRAALPLAATLLATLANPYGHGVWLYALGFGGDGQYAGQVWEWVAATPGRQPWLFLWLGVGALAALAAARRLMVLPWLVAAALLVSPLVASRFAFHGAVGAALALGLAVPALRSAARPLLRPGPARLLWALALALPLAAAGGSLRSTGAFHSAVDERFFPVGAVRFMERNMVKGRLLNYREWGGYLLWNRPGRKVFMDGRVAASAGAQLADYLAVVEAKPGYGHVLNRRGVQVVLSPHHMLRPADGAPLQPMARDPAWALTYFDDVALIYQRVIPASAEHLRRVAYRTLAPGDDRAPVRRGADPDLAEAELRRALATAPSTRAATYLGVLLMGRGRLEEAEQVLSAALVRSPGSLPLLNNLGVAAMRLGNRDEAMRLFKQVLKLNPEHKNAWRNLKSLERTANK